MVRATIGLKFVSNPHANVVQVKAVNPGTQAEKHVTLCPGLVLKAVGGTSVEGMSYQDTIGVIKTQGRPLTCQFGPVQPLPGAVSAAPRADDVSTACFAEAAFGEILLSMRDFALQQHDLHSTRSICNESISIEGRA